MINRAKMCSTTYLKCTFNKAHKARMGTEDGMHRALERERNVYSPGATDKPFNLCLHD